MGGGAVVGIGPGARSSSIGASTEFPLARATAALAAAICSALAFIVEYSLIRTPAVFRQEKRHLTTHPAEPFHQDARPVFAMDDARPVGPQAQYLSELPYKPERRVL
jgi:hypothetical protein